MPTEARLPLPIRDPGGGGRDQPAHFPGGTKHTAGDAGRGASSPAAPHPGSVRFYRLGGGWVWGRLRTRTSSAPPLLRGRAHRLPYGGPTLACTPRPPAFLPGLPAPAGPLPCGLVSPRPLASTLRVPHFLPTPLHTHFPAAPCVGRCSQGDPVPASLPTTLGSFCLRSGMRGSFILMRLKRPHSRCGAFFLPSESSLRGGA